MHHRVAAYDTAPAGFSSIELLLVIAIFSITMLLAAPGLQSFVYQRKADSVLQMLESNLNLARSYAVYNQLPVTYCASNNLIRCGGDWHQGALLFVDNVSAFQIDDIFNLCNNVFSNIFSKKSSSSSSI